MGARCPSEPGRSWWWRRATPAGGRSRRSRWPARCRSCRSSARPASRGSRRRAPRRSPAPRWCSRS
ncbi:MAG: hypothetical protein EBX35_14295 [Planctomycetia bacterium]|nr:hypothetical protein [Planctomycetia bacterium]